MQADAQFTVKHVTVFKNKFYPVLAILLQEVASQLLDLIRTPPALDPYKVLKERLITLYSLNDYQRFKVLVSLPLTRDQKPSHLMNRKLALSPTITSWTSSSGACFLTVYLQTFSLTFSRRRYQTQEL